MVEKMNASDYITVQILSNVLDEADRHNVSMSILKTSILFDRRGSKLLKFMSELYKGPYKGPCMCRP